MTTSEIYTVCLFYSWSKYGEITKDLLSKNDLVINQAKVRNLTNVELKDELLKFKIENELKFDGIDIINNNTCGLSGIYENDKKDIFIKIIKVENFVVLIYKGNGNGNEEEFYKKFIKHCRDVGCLIIKIVDGEITFKNRLNVEFINCINNIEKEKIIKLRNFNDRFSMFVDGTFSNDFKNKWISLINKI